MYKLRLSVLSSCLSLDLRHFLEEMSAQNIQNIDLYCFGEQDLDHIAEDGWRTRGVTRTIGELTVDRLEEETREVIETVCEQHETEINVVALATYMPDIGSDVGEERQACVNALTKLIELAGRLECRYLELVGGLKFSVKPESPAIARISRKQKREYIMEALPSLSRKAKGEGVLLGFELEPGPGYVLNSPAEAEALITDIKNNKNICDEVVGLNLDVGHMIIMEKTPEAFLDIEDRIFHAHVSDNARSHFADLVPGTFHSLHESEKGASFAAWLSFLRKLAAGAGKFSGHVAIELEASDDPEWVFSAHRRVAKLIERL